MNSQRLFFWKNKTNIFSLSSADLPKNVIKFNLSRNVRERTVRYVHPDKIEVIRRICAVWPRGYKTFFMLNSTEHEMFHANKSQITNNCKFFLAKHS